MLTVLRQHPGETRWSGRDGDLLFGIVVKPLPQGELRQRAVPAMLELVQMLAVHEVLKAKTLLERYAAAGLTDATTLRQAVEAAAGQLQVTGNAKGVVFQAARSGFAVAYIVAQQADLSAYLLQPTELEKVRKVMQGARKGVRHHGAVCRLQPTGRLPPASAGGIGWPKMLRRAGFSRASRSRFQPSVRETFDPITHV